jgi:ankyrin repeat protein
MDFLNKGAIMKELISSNNLKELREMVEKRPGLTNRKDKEGNTILHYAAMYGKRDIAAYIISKGAKISAKNKSRRTPIWYAIYANQLGIVQILVDTGFKCAPKIGISGNPIEQAMKLGRSEIVEMLLRSGKISKRHLTQFLAMAASYGFCDIIRMLHQLDGDLNKYVEYVERNCVKEIQEELRKGTPVMHAIKEKRWDAVRLLLENGANPKILRSMVWRFSTQLRFRNQ